MKSFSLDEYEALVARSVVLEQDRRGLKVLQTSDGLIVKFFRRKRLFSSALLKSYALRFVDNSRSLKQLGIRSVDVVDVRYCKSIKRGMVFYQPIPGQTLRSVLQSRTGRDEAMARFISFFAELHDKGVLFRSIHLNNVIVEEGLERMGLIDIADLKIAARSLSRKLRMRNFKHLTRYKADQEAIKTFGVERFIDLYLAASQLPSFCKAEFLASLRDAVAAEGRDE